jgi:hypothetical protein
MVRNISINEEILFPVCIADLPGYEFSVTPDVITEKIVAVLEDDPGLPGVMIVEKHHLLGVITRLKLFERLGHRFGVELFLQKPVLHLKDLVRIQSKVLQAHLRIDEAIQYALSRPAPDVFDPIVVQHKEGKLVLLDINTLLLAQSRAMASLSNVVGNLEQIDRLIYSDHDEHEILEKILQLLRYVVPYHQSSVLFADENGMRFIAQSGYSPSPERADDVAGSELYGLILKHRQAIYISKPTSVAVWQETGLPGNPAAWIGIPLLIHDRSLGLLMISRDVERSFNNEERETAYAFAQRISDLLYRRSQRKNPDKPSSSDFYDGFGSRYKIGTRMKQRSSAQSINIQYASAGR